MSAELFPWLCLCSIIFPSSLIRTTFVHQNTTERYVPVQLQIKHNWKKNSFMIWVHFCVYTGPSPSRAGQEMRLNSTKNTGKGRMFKLGGGCEKRGKDENDVFFCWIRIHLKITHVKVVLLNKMNSILVVCVYQSFFVFFSSSNCRISSSTALTSERWKVINSQAPSKYLNQDSGAEAFGGLYVSF